MPHAPAIRFAQIAALCFLGFGVQTLANADSGTGRLTLDQVRSYEYAIAAGPNTQGINNIIASSPSDMILLGGGDPTAPINRTVADPNHRKLIFGYIETTEATSYAEPSLFSNGIRSPLVGSQIAGYPGLYSVQYWDPTWKVEVLRQVDQWIASGYDGIFLDSLAYSDWTQGNSLGNPVYADAANALVSLVTAIRAHVNGKQLAYPFYLIGNVVYQSDQVYLGVISNLDAVFNESAYWGQPPSDGFTSVYLGTGNVQFLKTLSTTLLKNALVFANDYPNPLTNLDADFQSFALYNSLGWVPSVTKAYQTEEIFSTGPFMFTAVPSNSTVIGTKNFVNFISGGKAAAATLTGGDQGDYFIGGPGQNTITGGAGNDSVYAHPENNAVKNLLAIGLYADVQNSTTPTISVLINGQVALASSLVTATPGNIQEIKIDTTPFGTVSSIELDGMVAPYVDQNHYANIQFRSVTYQSQSLDFNQAQYNSGGRTLNGGATTSLANAILNQGGKMTFSSPTLPIAPPDFGNTSNTIDGGGGFNTVIYRAALANYSISQNSDGSWLVTSATTAEGPDTLKNIQLLQFSDAQAVPVGRGWNLLGNSTGSPTTVATTFNDATKVASVWKWDAANAKWFFYSPSLPAQALSDYASSRNYEVLTTINVGEGFWISTVVPNAQQLPPGASVPTTVFQATGRKPLGKGWNLVSTSDSVTPAQFVATQGSSVSSIWAWDNAQSKWYFYAPSLAAQGGTALSDYITANGYLDFASVNKTLGPGVGFWVNKP